MRSSRVWMTFGRVSVWMRSIGEWLEHQTANAKVATFLGSISCSIYRHSGIWGAVNEAKINKVHKNKKIPQLGIYSREFFAQFEFSKRFSWFEFGQIAALSTKPPVSPGLNFNCFALIKILMISAIKWHIFDFIPSFLYRFYNFIWPNRVYKSKTQKLVSSLPVFNS